MTLVWTPGWNGLTEPEAVSYVAAVEQLDGQPLEFATAKAINDFVLGCKNDGIWNAIKACCILSGARTLAGALVPLAGTAPTNFNFVSGDYNRKTGLKGTASSNKNLLTNYTVLASNVNNTHYSVFPTESISLNSALIGGSPASVANGLSDIYIDVNDTQNYFSNWTGNNYLGPLVRVNKLAGASRNLPGSFTARGNNTNQTISQAVVGSPQNHGMRIFTRDTAGVAQSYSTGARLAFYSIGESLDLALLDARVTALINAFAAAIP